MNFKTPVFVFALALLAHAAAQADEFDIPPPVVEKFAREFQDALGKHDVDRVVSLVKFPLRVNAQGAKTLRVGKTQLVKDFDLIFSSAVVKQVLDQNPADLFQNYQGVMFGNGAVWADEFCGARKRPDCPVLVKAVNHAEK
ncbi:MAG: hypothetical protein JNK28_06240 [Burkholderiaceae bacterium]|nr:hypothetical protein [Burkholderiaceae bacterium]